MSRNFTSFSTGLVVTLLVGAALGTSCAILSPVVERAADRTADAVEGYCANFTADQRSEFRTGVNQQLPEDTSVAVSCPGDAAELME